MNQKSPVDICRAFLFARDLVDCQWEATKGEGVKKFAMLDFGRFNQILRLEIRI
jgi:hypothetical protein